MSCIDVKVPSDFSEPLRLDKFIASLPDGMNRSKLKSGVTEILVNGKKSKMSSKVKSGDEIKIEWEDSVPDDIIPENIPLDIVFENEDVCVIDKKQGMVTHPASGNWSGTLVNALLYHWGREKLHPEKGLQENEIIAKCRPGIVHRLDKDTSGLIITAKNRASEEDLQSKFQSRKVIKEYIAIVRGKLPEKKGEVKTLIARDPSDRKKFKAFELPKNWNAMTEEEKSGVNGKFSWTLYREVKSYGNYTLVRLRLKTGRTHQIRVHLKYLGCPILGDPIYCGNKKDSLFPEATLMLNAYYLKIALPGCKEASEFKGKVPERFLKVINVLKNGNSSNS